MGGSEKTIIKDDYTLKNKLRKCKKHKTVVHTVELGLKARSRNDETRTNSNSKYQSEKIQETTRGPTYSAE